MSFTAIRLGARMNLYEEIKKDTGLSAQKLADLTKCNICSMYNYVAGRSKPRYKRTTDRLIALRRMLNLLSKKPDFLVELFEQLDNDD